MQESQKELSPKSNPKIIEIDKVIAVVNEWLCDEGRVLLPEDLDRINYSKLENRLLTASKKETKPVEEEKGQFVATLRISTDGHLNQALDFLPGVVGRVIIINNSEGVVKLQIGSVKEDVEHERSECSSSSEKVCDSDGECSPQT